MSEYIQKQPSSNPIVAYGQRSAHYLLVRATRVPASQRKEAVKTVLDAIDPTLYARASARADKAMAIGIPPAIALERGLAAAMSDGVLKEMMQVGRKKQAPAKRSLLGLGCFGCGAVLGDVAETVAKGGLSTTLATTTTTTAPTSREHRGEDTGGAGVRHTPHPSTTTGQGPTIGVGPFVFGVSGGGITWHQKKDVEKAIPATWKTYLVSEIAKLQAANPPVTGMMGLGKLVTAGSLGLDKWLGMRANEMVPARFFNGSTPAFKTTNPTKPGNWGVYFVSTPALFGVAMKHVPPPQRNFFGRLWDSIKSIPSILYKAGEKIYDYAKDAARYLKEQACKLANNGAVQAAATAGGTAAGGPAGGTAASTGIGIVAGLCAPDAPDQVVNEDAAGGPSGSLLPLVLIGGAGAALLLFTGKGH